MTDKFQDKYRIPSARLQNWDYGSDAMYFVTICTAHRECYFGNIVNVKTPESGVSTTAIELSEIGNMAHRFWTEIPNHFPFVELGEFVVMPNHVHGIIIIDKPNDTIRNATVETSESGVSTMETADANETGTPGRTDAASQKWYSGTLGVIINQYKRACTINARKIHSDFTWQSRFYDHIIRNDDSFQRISNYILNNPLNWAEDQFFMS